MSQLVRWSDIPDHAGVSHREKLLQIPGRHNVLRVGWGDCLDRDISQSAPLMHNDDPSLLEK